MTLLAYRYRQIQTDLPAAVTRARDHNLSWAQIGDLLATTRAAACNRYGHPRPPDQHLRRVVWVHAAPAMVRLRV